MSENIRNAKIASNRWHTSRKTDISTDADVCLKTVNNIEKSDNSIMWLHTFVSGLSLIVIYTQRQPQEEEEYPKSTQIHLTLQCCSSDSRAFVVQSFSQKINKTPKKRKKTATMRSTTTTTTTTSMWNTKTPTPKTVTPTTTTHCPAHTTSQPATNNNNSTNKQQVAIRADKVLVAPKTNSKTSQK